MVREPDRSDILNIGSFSDAVFSVVAAFLAVCCRNRHLPTKMEAVPIRCVFGLHDLRGTSQAGAARTPATLLWADTRLLRLAQKG